MTAADLNGDGRGDVAAIREGGGSPGLFPLLFILINRGGDEFSFSTRSLLNERAWGPLVAADLDADAHPDLACVSEELSYVALLWNSGQGRFEGFLPPPPRPGTFSALGPLLLADLDRDAHLDLLAQGQSPPSLVLLPGRGDGAFGESRAVPFLRTPADLAAADVDGDDDLDLVTAEVSDGAALYINSGEGCFGIPRRLASGGFIRKVSPADLDGDNRLDLAFLNGQPLHRLSVTWNEGGDAWSDVLLIATVGCADLVAAGDFDGNGRSDLAVASCSPRGIFLHSSREGRSFGEGVGLELGQGTVHALAARDLDRDGRLDLAASFTTTSSSGILVYWNEGNGTFAPPVEHSSPAPAERLVFVDLEGDGDTDLAAFARGIVTFFRRREGRTFDRWGASLALSASDTPVAGDLNEDGLVDFVVPVELNRGIAVLLGGRTDPESRDDDGDGLPDECEATRFHRGDANADGSLDITDPVFLLSYLFLAGVQPACLEAADADDDGRLDLTDGVWLLNYLFLEGPPPPAPGPPGSSPCGPDPDAADPPGALGCDAYSGC
jgi:hypothetical protein